MITNHIFGDPSSERVQPYESTRTEIHAERIELHIEVCMWHWNRKRISQQLEQTAQYR